MAVVAIGFEGFKVALFSASAEEEEEESWKCFSLGGAGDAKRAGIISGRFLRCWWNDGGWGYL